jgi:hypothetical protein
MKIIHAEMVLGLLFAAGCLPFQVVAPDSAAKAVPEISPRPGAPRNLVGPDQVEEANARDKAKALQQELELDARDAAKTSVTNEKR